MRFRRLQYGAGFGLILLLFLARAALYAPSSERSGQPETVSQRLHRNDPFAIVYTASDTVQEWRERIPTDLRLERLIPHDYTSLARRLVGPLPVPASLPHTTVNGVEIRPARLDQLDSYLRELFSWAM